MMKEKFSKNDVVKFVDVWSGEKDVEETRFENTDYEMLLKFIKGEEEGKNAVNEGMEFVYYEDDLCGYGYEFGGNYTLRYDEPFLDEEELVFNDNASLMAVEISKKGLPIISDEFKIGERFDYENLKKVFEGETVGRMEFDEMSTIAEVILDDFTVDYRIFGGFLMSATIYAISR